MKPTQTDKINKKRLCIFTLLAGALLYSLYCFVIEPAYIASLYDVTYEGSVVPDVLNYLGRIVEVIAMSLCYATAAYYIYSLGGKGFGGALLIYLALGAYKYGANMLMSWVQSGETLDVWYIDLLFALINLFTETIPYLIACLIFKGIFESYRQRNAILAKAGRAESVYPFTKLYDKNNPLMKAALTSALALLIPKLLGQILNDVIQIVEITNLPLMILAYLLNIIFGVLGYITVTFAFVLYFEKIAKK